MTVSTEIRVLTCRQFAKVVSVRTAWVNFFAANIHPPFLPDTSEEIRDCSARRSTLRSRRPEAKGLCEKLPRDSIVSLSTFLLQVLMPPQSISASKVRAFSTEFESPLAQVSRLRNPSLPLAGYKSLFLLRPHLLSLHFTTHLPHSHSYSTNTHFATTS